MKLSLKYLILFAGFTLSCLTGSGNIVTNTQQLTTLTEIYYYKAKPQETITSVQQKEFLRSTTTVVNLGLTNSEFWLKIPLTNNTEGDEIFLDIQNANLSQVELFAKDQYGRYTSVYTSGTDYNFSKREFATPNFIIKLNQPQGSTQQYFIRVKSNLPLVIPIFAGTRMTIERSFFNVYLIFCIYIGIIVCMLFYNLFLMVSVRNDRSYFWYVLHTFFVGLTQASILGFAFQYLWPNIPSFTPQSVILFTCAVSIVGIIFMQVFLNTKATVPKLHRLFYGFISVYVIIMVLSLSKQFTTAYQLLQPTQGLVALFILFVSIRMVRQGHKQARFYLLSWSFLMVAIILFALKDYNLVPYNKLTANSMLFGSGLQVILLSFALGDKINILEGEKISSQEEALRMSQENERIIREQNIILESKVNERTAELKASNEELAKTLKELQEAETQLVESEKMASLGQLTAGIAHEINNPINFVTSNVSPLRRDVELLIDMVNQLEQIGIKEGTSEDKKQEIEALKEEMDYDYLKQEIDYLIRGISDGASRTAEIVKGLRVFSRLDEDDLKRADINEGLNSTLVIVNHLLGNHIKVEKNYSGIPLVECFPGKLNQVFLNMMSNAIHAINARWGEEPNGKLTLSTWNDEQNVYVSIKDNGTGMDEDTKKKIFEPFFTTKEVGEGTGLGMSIAYNTIRKHHGSIQINSALGEGTEFVISLPIVHELVKS